MLSMAEIRVLLLKCNNQVLKTYLLVLASGGMRTVEDLAIRIKDIDFDVKPTTVHIRSEFFGPDQKKLGMSSFQRPQ